MSQRVKHFIILLVIAISAIVINPSSTYADLFIPNGKRVTTPVFGGETCPVNSVRYYCKENTTDRYRFETCEIYQNSPFYYQVSTHDGVSVYCKNTQFQLYMKYILAVLLTLAIEVIVAIFFKLKKAKFIAILVLVNVITNPLANKIYENLAPLTSTIGNITIQILLETIIIAVEYVLLKKLYGKANKLPHFVITANIISWIIGGMILASIIG